MANRYATVDEYIGALPADVQVVLQEVRQRPGCRTRCSKTIRYQIPTIAINGRSLVHYASLEAPRQPLPGTRW